MKLKIKALSFSAGRPISILNSKTADKINVHIGERILLSKYGDNIISIIDVSKDFVKPDEIAVSAEILDELKVNEDDDIEVSLAQKPESTIFIRKKMDNFTLTKDEIFRIIRDIVENALTEAEIAYFVSAVYKNGMTEAETKYLIEAMVSTGKRLNFPGIVVDKHSIGGIAGNRTTPLVVSICASAGLTIPKTSSRAITSAAGTADVIESIAKVEFTVEEIKKIVEKTKGCMVWGGSLGLSPADDKLIQVERILNLDPEPQLLASVLSKKISVGSEYVLIDIPYGKTAKVNRKKGEDLKKKFEKLGKHFGLKIKCVLTDGSQPIGNGMGPLLEIRDVIKILKNDSNAPKDLRKKAIFLTGEIFELAGMAKKGSGEKMAEKILVSGKAFEKFKEIIQAQNGKVPSMSDLEKKLGKYKKDILADSNSYIKEINNRKINILANVAGSPMDAGAGIYLHKHVNNNIKKGDKILTIYSESEGRIKRALEFYNTLNPIVY